MEQDADPVTLEAFVTPVVASDGHTYELSSLREWLATKWDKASPLTRQTLRPIAFWDEHTAFRNGLVVPQARAFTLYEGDSVAPDGSTVVLEIHVRIGIMQAVALEWLAALLEAKGLIDKTLCLKSFVYPQSGGKPRVIGYPCATNLCSQLEEVCRALSLDAMWDSCENLASASVSIKSPTGWLRMCTVEELLNDPAAWAAWNASHKPSE